MHNPLAAETSYVLRLTNIYVNYICRDLLEFHALRHLQNFRGLPSPDAAQPQRFAAVFFSDECRQPVSSLPQPGRL